MSERYCVVIKCQGGTVCNYFRASVEAETSFMRLRSHSPQPAHIRREQRTGKRRRRRRLEGGGSVKSEHREAERKSWGDCAGRDTAAP